MFIKRTFIKRTLIVSLSLVPLLFAVCSVADSGFMLVSQDEYRAQVGHKDQRADRGHRKMLSFNAPSIKVITPKGLDNVASPVDIDVVFRAMQGEKINPDSIKVLYGWLSLDVTERIRENATINHQGIKASNVKLPSGSHSLVIVVSDTKGRENEKEIEFSIDN